MKLDDLTLGDIKQLQGLFSQETKANLNCENWGKQIVVLQRGWVAIGDLTKKGEYMELTNASIIRRWGTKQGLGQLASEGKQSNTELEPTPKMKFHELTVITTIEVDATKW
jgi:hypothetical protein